MFRKSNRTTESSRSDLYTLCLRTNSEDFAAASFHSSLGSCLIISESAHIGSTVARKDPCLPDGAQFQAESDSCLESSQFIAFWTLSSFEYPAFARARAMLPVLQTCGSNPC